MTWVVFSLGDLDLRYLGSDSSYFVDDSSSDIDENRTNEYVALRSADGARLAYSRGMEMPVDLNVLCVGDSRQEAKTARDALAQVLVDARNGRVDGVYPLYQIQEDDSLIEPAAWFVIGGKIRNVRSFSGSARVVGFQGRYVQPVILHLDLSKS